MGDTCTQFGAEEWLKHDVLKSVNLINSLKWNVPLTQNQYDSLVSFQYNTGALKKSTLYKKASVNPNDTTIYKYMKDNKGMPLAYSCEYLKWVYVGDKVNNGLRLRRAKEAKHYSRHLKINK